MTVGASPSGDPAGRATPQAPAGLDQKATIRCADLDLWLLLLKDVHSFVGADPMNTLATEKLAYVLHDMGLVRRMS